MKKYFIFLAISFSVLFCIFYISSVSQADFIDFRSYPTERNTDHRSGIALDDEFGRVYHFYFPDICTDSMQEHLLKYSNIGNINSEQLIIATIGLPPGMNVDEFNQCAQEAEFSKSRVKMVRP